VWVGNFDRTPLHLSSGVTGAGPIFHAVMLAANRGRESMGAHEILPPPADVEEVTICVLSGMRASAWCPSRAKEWVAAGDEPLPCAWHHQSGGGVVTIYPPEFRAWAAGADGHNLLTVRAANDALPARLHAEAFARAGERPRTDAAATLSIANPPAGATYSVDPTLRREFQALPLRAVSLRPTMLTWLVDGATIGTASSERSLAWPLAVGAHDIEARDPDGRIAKTSVVVK